MLKTKITLLLCSMLTILSGAIIAPTLPVIEERFDHGGDETFFVSLLLTISSLFIALSSPLMGFLVDKIGRRKILLTSLSLYGFFGSAGLYLNSLESLLISRILLGISVSGIITTCLTLAGDYFEGEERKEFFGYQSSFIALGGFIFLTTSGYLASYYWRASFALYLISFLFLIPAVRYLREPEDISQRVLPSESRTFSLKTYIYVLFTAFLGMTFYFVIPTRLPFLLHENFGYLPHETGLLLGMSTLFGALVSSQYSKIQSIFSKAAIYGYTFCMMGFGMILIAIAEGKTGYFIAIGSLGSGFGLLIPNSTTWVTKLAPESMRGRLIGLLSSSLFVAQFIATLFGELLNNNFGDQGLGGLFGVEGAFSLSLGVFILLYCFRTKTMRAA